MILTCSFHTRRNYIKNVSIQTLFEKSLLHTFMQHKKTEEENSFFSVLMETPQVGL